MTTDNKTLADVQPGGRVRLGDQAELDRHEFQAWTRELLPCPFCGNSAESVPYKDNGLTLKCKSMGCIQRNQRTLRYGIDWLRTSMAEHWNTRALSAQPSPGGQDALPPMPACRDRQPDDMPGYMESALDWVRDVDNCDAVDWLIDNHAAIRAALAARQPVGEPFGWLIARSDVSPFFVPASHPEIVECFRTELAAEVGTTVTEVFTTPQPPAQAVDLGQFRGWLCTTTDGVATDWTLEDDSRLRFERMGRTIEPIYAASTDKPSTLADALQGRRNRLMNSYGNGAREDAAIDTQIAEIDAELAKVDSQAVGNK